MKIHRILNNNVVIVLDDYYYPNHIATDFYHHWKEDIALFAEMGFKLFRKSISQSRRIRFLS